MALSPGARLGPYEIIEPLGAGGMGEVYRARDARLRRDVAIKVLPPAFLANPDRRSRFEQEARAAAALNHPNVVAVFDVHTEGEIPYVVSELLEGETLRSLLARGPLPLRKAVDFAAQMARGLAAAHQKGIVHRDLKPANLFITSDGRAKLLDFGLARVNDPRGADQPTNLPAGPATSPGAVLGTVGYMSPEQARGDTADTRSDIFSLGVVCYEMLAGRPTFDGRSDIEVMSAILRDDPPDLPETVVPPTLQRVIRRCLEKVPADRFQSATDLAFALDALSNPASRLVPPVDAPPAKPRSTWTIGAVAAALVGGLILGGGLIWQLIAPAAPDPVRYEARTFDRLPVMNARFMPDGQAIVFSAATRGNASELFILNPTAEAPQSLEVTDAHLLSVSSTGELALIVNARYWQQRLYKGTLARMTLGSSPRAVQENVREADWSPEGSELAVVRDLGNGRDRLEFPIGTALHEASGYLSDPRVSPDGTRVAFVAHPWLFDDRGSVMVASRDGVTRLTEELWSIQGLAWSADGARVMFSGNASGGSFMEPMAVPVAGGQPPSTLFSMPGRLIVHDIARDGRWLAVREDLSFGVRARVPDSDEERDLSWLGSAGARSLSPDGRQLLMVDVGQRAGVNYGVVLRATDGSRSVRLGTGNAQTLSPDGRWAAANIADPSEIVVYPTGAGEPVRLPTTAIGQVESVEWFADNKQLLVCGALPSRPSRCYRQELSGTPPTPVTDEGTVAAVAPDGTTMLLSRSDGSFAAGRVGTVDTKPLASLETNDRVVGWSRDSSAVFVQRGNAVPARVDRIDLVTGARTLAREIMPAGVSGVTGIVVADWIDEGRYYAYNYTMLPSTLFVVSGVR